MSLYDSEKRRQRTCPYRQKESYGCSMVTTSMALADRIPCTCEFPLTLTLCTSSFAIGDSHFVSMPILSNCQFISQKTRQSWSEVSDCLILLWRSGDKAFNEKSKCLCIDSNVVFSRPGRFSTEWRSGEIVGPVDVWSKCIVSACIITELSVVLYVYQDSPRRRCRSPCSFLVSNKYMDNAKHTMCVKVLEI